MHCVLLCSTLSLERGGGFHWLGRKWPQCSKATCPDDDTGSTFPAPVRSHPGNRKPFPCWHKPWDSKCYSFIFFFFFCTLFLSSNSLFILFFKLIVSPPACLPLSDTPQALKALQDMSLTSPCSPPPLHSMRHSKSIPVQAFEVCTDIHQTCTPTYCTSLPAVSLQCDVGQYHGKWN